MLNGYKTYIGIGVAGLALLAHQMGYDFDVESVNNNLVAIGGLLVAVYGRYHVEKRNA